MARGRKASVRYFESKNGFFGVVNGKRIRLVSCDADDSPDGPHFMESVKKWIALTEMSNGKGTPEYTLRALANSYRLMLTEGGRTTTISIYGRLKSFVAIHGVKPVSSLKVFHFTDWMK